MGRVIFHIDLNAFFANAEIILDPSLKGKPIAVAGSTRRSVVSTCSYEARKFGVHSAMPVQEALRLCPDLLIVSSHYDFYESLSMQFIDYIKTYTPLVEQVSIDECYADVTDIIMTYPKPLDLAWKIQKELLEKYKLQCSIGVAPNKFLAKMASDMKKPKGITVLRISEVESKLWPLDIKEMRGIGNKTVPIMRDLGINTIGDLAKYEDINQLRMIFGKNTDILLEKTRGHDKDELVSNVKMKSISQSTTLLEDISDYEEIRGVFNSLSRSLTRRMHNEKVAGSIISITIKYHDFRSSVKSKRLTSPIFKQMDIFEYALDLFDDAWNNEPIRLLGIGVSDIKPIKEIATQMDLFSEPTELSVKEVLNDLNSQLKTGKLKVASELLKEK